MKKIIASLLLLTSSAAFAVDYSLSLVYDYDRYNTNSARVDHVYKTGVMLGARTGYGMFDTTLYNNGVRGEGFADDQLGLEAGYSLAHKFAPKWSIGGRVAYGRIFNRGLRAPESTGDYQTARVGVGYALTPQTSVGVSYRHRWGDLGRAKQYTTGITHSFDKHYSLRTNFNHTVFADGRQANGIATLLTYTF